MIAFLTHKNILQYNTSISEGVKMCNHVGLRLLWALFTYGLCYIGLIYQEAGCHSISVSKNSVVAFFILLAGDMTHPANILKPEISLAVYLSPSNSMSFTCRIDGHGCNRHISVWFLHSLSHSFFHHPLNYSLGTFIANELNS